MKNLFSKKPARNPKNLDGFFVFYPYPISSLLNIFNKTVRLSKTQPKRLVSFWLGFCI